MYIEPLQYKTDDEAEMRANNGSATSIPRKRELYGAVGTVDRLLSSMSVLVPTRRVMDDVYHALTLVLRRLLPVSVNMTHSMIHDRIHTRLSAASSASTHGKVGARSN